MDPLAGFELFYSCLQVDAGPGTLFAFILACSLTRLCTEPALNTDSADCIRGCFLQTH
jgi:hypothetical protein